MRLCFLGPDSSHRQIPSSAALTSRFSRTILLLRPRFRFTGPALQLLIFSSDRTKTSQAPTPAAVAEFLLLHLPV
ncbi:hypothetical protein MY4824_004854 [Beauveria thailandica]